MRPKGSKERLAEILRQGAQAAGFPTDGWPLRRVAHVIERELGVRYHPGWVWYILHRRGMGWSSQKPERRARERDEEAIQAWRAQEWKKKSPGRMDGLSCL